MSEAIITEVNDQTQQRHDDTQPVVDPNAQEQRNRIAKLNVDKEILERIQKNVQDKAFWGSDNPFVPVPDDLDDPFKDEKPIEDEETVVVDLTKPAQYGFNSAGDFYSQTVTIGASQ